MVNHVTQAMIAGLLDPAAEKTLQRSAARGPDHPPISVDDCPDWQHQVPMILLKDLCNPTVTTRQPPRGKVMFIDPGLADAYLLDLARLDVINLQQNPAYRPGGATGIIAPLHSDTLHGDTDGQRQR